MKKLLFLFLLTLPACVIQERECVEYQEFCYHEESVTSWNMNNMSPSFGSVKQYFDCSEASSYPDYETETVCKLYTTKP